MNYILPIYILILGILIIIVGYNIFYSPKNNKPQNITKNNENLTVLVTGGARGIGEAYVIALLKRGYRVAILDILNAEKKANELKQIYGDDKVIGIYCDVTDKNSYNNAFEKASLMSSDGILDIVIFNAGINSPLFSDNSKIIQTNLEAPMYGTELYIRQITNDLKEPSKKDALIVITGSLASFVPIDVNLSPAYDSSKAGVATFVRSCKPLAVRYNFRINAVCPAGMVNTGMTKPLIDTYFKQKTNDVFLMTEGRGSIMEPKDIPPALLKIIDDKTINGDLVAVNTSLGINANIEPLDEFGAFKEYGIWSESASYIIPKAIDYNLKNILSDQTKIWSN